MSDSTSVYNVKRQRNGPVVEKDRIRAIAHRSSNYDVDVVLGSNKENENVLDIRGYGQKRKYKGPLAELGIAMLKKLTNSSSHSFSTIQFSSTLS